jgi:hypothetical protein
MELLRSLWRGDVSLVRTFWGFGVGGYFFFGIASTYVESQRAIFSTNIKSAVVISLGLLLLVYCVLVFVAIWRSANKYKGLQRYAILAKACVVVGVLVIITGIVLPFL